MKAVLDLIKDDPTISYPSLTEQLNIFCTWEAENYMAPTVEECSSRSGPDRTVVTLPLAKKDESLAIPRKSQEKYPVKPSMENRMDRVLIYIKNDPTTSVKSVSDALNLTVSQVRTAIEKLREQGKVTREGSDTDGRWIVRDDVEE